MSAPAENPNGWSRSELQFWAGTFLSYAGVPFAEVLCINTNDLCVFAGAVRTFSCDVSTTMDDATGVVHGLRDSWSGYSYRALLQSWAQMNGRNMEDLHEACEMVASALEGVAPVIDAAQIAVLTELAILGVTFVASHAALIPTMGLSGAASAAAAAAGNKLVTALENTVVSLLMEQVIIAAIEPLEETVMRAINGVGKEALADYLDVDVNNLLIVPDDLNNAANQLDLAADAIADAARRLSESLAALQFIDNPPPGVELPPPDYYVADLPDYGPAWYPDRDLPERFWTPEPSPAYAGIGSGAFDDWFRPEQAWSDAPSDISADGSPRQLAAAESGSEATGSGAGNAGSQLPAGSGASGLSASNPSAVADHTNPTTADTNRVDDRSGVGTSTGAGTAAAAPWHTAAPDPNISELTSTQADAAANTNVTAAPERGTEHVVNPAAPIAMPPAASAQDPGQRGGNSPAAPPRKPAAPARKRPRRTSTRRTDRSTGTPWAAGPGTPPSAPPARPDRVTVDGTDIGRSPWRRGTDAVPASEDGAPKPPPENAAAPAKAQAGTPRREPKKVTAPHEHPHNPSTTTNAAITPQTTSTPNPSPPPVTGQPTPHKTPTTRDTTGHHRPERGRRSSNPRRSNPTTAESLWGTAQRDSGTDATHEKKPRQSRGERADPKKPPTETGRTGARHRRPRAATPQRDRSARSAREPRNPPTERRAAPTAQPGTRGTGTEPGAAPSKRPETATKKPRSTTVRDTELVDPKSLVVEPPRQAIAPPTRVLPPPLTRILPPNDR